jgi:hypothetical protein
VSIKHRSKQHLQMSHRKETYSLSSIVKTVMSLFLVLTIYVFIFMKYEIVAFNEFYYVIG